MADQLTRDEIQAELDRLGPFYMSVGLPFGLRTPVLPGGAQRAERRVPEVVDRAFPRLLELCGGSLEGARVLDTGCNCGGFAFAAADAGASEVLGIDTAERYVEQAQFLARVLGHDDVSFRCMAVEDLDAFDEGAFDVTFCFGLLYHFENPVASMRALARVTKRVMVVDTMLHRPRFERFVGRGAMWSMKFPGPDVATETTNLWRPDRVCELRPNALAVRELLSFLGFTTVEQLPAGDREMQAKYGDSPSFKGLRGTFVAAR